MTLEEFIARLETMQREYPADAGETLEKGAKRMVRALKKATPKSRRKKSSRQHLTQEKEQPAAPEKPLEAEDGRQDGRAACSQHQEHGTTLPSGKQGRAKSEGCTWESETGMARRVKSSCEIL